MIVMLEVDETKFRGPFTFNEINPHWRKNSELNRHFLQVQQAYFNHMLEAVGYVFLNDVLNGLGIPKTPIGQLVGWTQSDSVFIEFGISENADRSGEFQLTFNVSGIIVEKIQ